jgi:hypothetical protein
VSDRYLVLAQRLGAQRDQLLAEVERLRAEVERATEAVGYFRDTDLASQLGAANALLERGRQPFESVAYYEAWDRDVGAHLAAQPATAPIYVEGRPGHSGYNLQPATAPTRTEAEQRVLDAMGHINLALLLSTVNAKNRCSDEEREAARAELARRELKP